jgi:hypothetical protein
MPQDETRCPRFGKWIGGCLFEARYDLSPANLDQFVGSIQMSATMAEKFRSKTYVRDICVRCGKTKEVAS